MLEGSPGVFLLLCDTRLDEWYGVIYSQVSGSTTDENCVPFHAARSFSAITRRLCVSLESHHPLLHRDVR